MRLRKELFVCAASVLATPALAQESVRTKTQTGTTTPTPAEATSPAKAEAAVSAQAEATTSTASTGGQIAEILVTAQRRSENLQRVPIAVTAFTAAALDGRNLNEIGELRASVPNLQIGTGGGLVQPFLRGIGNTAIAIGNEASVAVYIDGVYYTTLATGFFALNNIERLEVLKGPQGTLFGRNASGGVIQLVTKDPSVDTVIQGELSYGNFNTIEGNLYATTGFGERVAIDISLSGKYQNDGFGRNITTDNRFGYNDFFSARSKLRFETGERTTLTVTGLYGYSKNSIQGNFFPGTTQGYYSPPFDQVPRYGFYDTAGDRESALTFKQYGVTFKAEQELSFAQFTSTTAYIHVDLAALVDGDWGPRPDFLVPQDAATRQFTQEFQLASLPGSDFVWQLGAFYYRTRQRYNEGTLFLGEAVFGPGLETPASQLARSYAIYGQATYEVLPGLKFTGGLRYTWDKTSADGTITLLTAPPLVLQASNPATVKFDKLTFRTAVDYQFTDLVLGYASFSRGFKSQAFNLLTYAPDPTQPESVDAYEVGLKTDLFDRRVRLNVSGFYYDVSDPQVTLQRGGGIILSNAESVEVKGVEADLTVVLVDGFSLRGSLAYLNSKYKDYGDIDSVTGECIDCAPSAPPIFVSPFGATAPAIGIVADGNRTSRAPKWSGNVGFDYLFSALDGEFAVTADYYLTSGFFYEPDNIIRQGGYSLLSAQLRYSPNKKLDFKVFGKNMTDKKYTTYAGTQSGPAGIPYLAGAPRTYGVSLGFKF